MKNIVKFLRWLCFMAVISTGRLGAQTGPSPGGRTKESGQLSLNAAVEAQQSALGLIDRIDFKFTNRLDFLRGAPGRRNDFESRYSRDSGRERLREDFINDPPAAGAKTPMHHHRDILHEGSQSRQLFGWDPGNPKTLKLGFQQGVVGTIDPPSQSLRANLDPLSMLLLTFEYPGSNARHSLAEIVKNSPRTDWKGKVRAGDRDLYVLRAYCPGKNGGPSDGSYHEIYLDPAVNFLVRRSIVHFEKMPAEAPNAASWTPKDSTTEIEKFESFGDGVFFPVLAVGKLQDLGTGEPLTGRRVEVTDLTVNRPLPADAFDFVFPENLLVRDNSAGTGKQRAQLWGSNNKPKLEITSDAQLTALLEQDARGPAPRKIPVWAGVLVVNVAMVLIVVGLIIRKRRRA